MMKSYAVTLTEDHLRVIAAALNELPAKHSRLVLNDLETQVAKQDQEWDRAKWDATGGKPNG